MNRIISINIRGVVFQIEEDAFDYLDHYLKKLKRHFQDEDGTDEILADIENRIAEMLTRDPGLQGSVNLDRVKAIVSQMGEPEEIDAESEEENEYRHTYNPSGKRVLFRDPEHRWMGGVCSGLGNYFDTDPLWIRILFLFAFLTFGTGLLLYVLLWALIPEAKTTSERLEMKGEKVTIDTIEKTVREGFDRIKKDFDDADIADNTKRAAKQAGKAIGGVARTGVQVVSRLFGLALVTTILISMVVAGFAYFGFLIDLWRTPFFPFFQQLFETQAEYILYSLSLAGLFVLPMIGALYLGIRLLLGIRQGSPWIGKSIGLLWIVALVFSIALVFQLSSAWSEHAVLSDERTLTNSDTLYIESSNITVYNQKEYTLEFGRSRGIRGIYAKENGQLKRPIKLNIQPANVSTILLKEHRHSNGKTHEQAAELASKISHELAIDGNHLVFNPYFSVDDQDVWKNQYLEYDLFVPVGKVVVFGSNTATFLNHVNTETYIHNGGLQGKAFQMTAKGLKIEKSTMNTALAGESFTYSGFSQLQLEGIPEIILFENDEYTIYTAIGASYTPQFEEKGKKLRVFLNPLASGNAQGALYIGMPQLNVLEVMGDSKLSVKFRELSTIRAELSGAVKMEGELIADHIKIESNGMNHIQLQGKANELRTEMNGSGECNLEKLEATSVHIEVNGTSRAAVFVSNKLHAEAGGASVITYYGNPVNKTLDQSAGARIIKASDQE